MKTFINDHTKNTSYLINERDIPEICGISNTEYFEKYNNNFQLLNEELNEFDFSNEPFYPENF